MKQVLFPLLMIASVLLVVFGFLFLSEATTGVGMIGIACFFGIVCRIIQAQAHHSGENVASGEVKLD